MASPPLPAGPCAACGLWLPSSGTAALGSRSPGSRSGPAGRSQLSLARVPRGRCVSPPPQPTAAPQLHTSCPHYPPPSPSPQRCSPLPSPPPGEGREGAWQGLDLCSCYPAPRTRSLQEERGPRRCPAAPCLSRPAQPPLSPPPLGETLPLSRHGHS